jgi:hypothetical protein
MIAALKRTKVSMKQATKLGVQQDSIIVEVHVIRHNYVLKTQMSYMKK